MSIVYVQMYVIDVCYCVVSHVVSFVCAVVCYVGMVYVLQNFKTKYYDLVIKL